MTESHGRLLLPGPTDGAAERRVPTQPLRLIPSAARASFAPWITDLPGLKPGENDLGWISVSPQEFRAER